MLIKWNYLKHSSEVSQSHANVRSGRRDLQRRYSLHAYQAIGLPAADDDVDVEGIELHAKTPPPRPFGRKLIIRLGGGAEALAVLVDARRTIRALAHGPAG